MTEYIRRKPAKKNFFWCYKQANWMLLTMCIARGERKEEGCIRCRQRDGLLREIEKERNGKN